MATESRRRRSRSSLCSSCAQLSSCAARARRGRAAARARAGRRAARRTTAPIDRGAARVDRHARGRAARTARGSRRMRSGVQQRQPGGDRLEKAVRQRVTEFDVSGKYRIAAASAPAMKPLTSVGATGDTKCTRPLTPSGHGEPRCRLVVGPTNARWTWSGSCASAPNDGSTGGARLRVAARPPAGSRLREAEARRFATRRRRSSRASCALWRRRTAA